ncbi:hypothetical protein [Photorhabdus heterorhabditis]|uniref:Uncharacterized protein n=1 Tax=Photorhabdus heterorhabditis TaxID=880156 RepID=A0A5B0V9V4_9GAMM|nr:hypothetical protein [Photorhabdus heterorhabditis]KAA1170963.1 hypothetical protein F0L16_21955 [Photorhabdus heterorhabditis]
MIPSTPVVIFDHSRYRLKVWNNTAPLDVLTRILDKKLTRSLFQEQSFGADPKTAPRGNRLWTT